MASINIYKHKELIMPLFYKGIFFISILLLSFNCQAQFFDSIRTSLTYKPKLDVKLDSRNGFISASVARIIGLKVGLDYNKTFKIGAGYNFLFSDIKQNVAVVDHSGNRNTIQGEYRFQYLALYSEYVFYKNDPWEISILAHFGGGVSRIRYTDLSGNSSNTPSKFVLLYEPYMTAQYKFLKYFGVGAGVGYRLAYSSDQFSRRQLNSPIYVYKFKFFFAEFYQDVLKKRIVD